MQPSDKKTTITEEIESERLRKWREKRAKVAETSRQERLRIAEAERRDRLQTFEAEKLQRIKSASEKRAQEKAAEQAERMATARSRIAGRTDIDAARKRLLAYRARAAKLLALRLTAFVVLPTVAVAYYLYAVATPLYSSETRFALSAPTSIHIASNTSPFASSEISREVHLLREVLVSPETLHLLDDRNSFSEHFSAQTVDPLSRVGTPLLSPQSAFKRYISVAANGQDGIIRIEAKATDPVTALELNRTILDRAELWVSKQRVRTDVSQSQSLRMVTEPTLPRAAAYPLKLETLALAFLGFCGLYAGLSIFGRTLLRHQRS